MSPFVPILAAAAVVAAASDIRSRRVPNALTGALAIAGMTVAGAIHGFPGVGVALAILAVILGAGTVRLRARMVRWGRHQAARGRMLRAEPGLGR